MAPPVHVIFGRIGDHNGKGRMHETAEPGWACWFGTNDDLIAPSGALTDAGRQLTLAVAARKPGAKVVIGEADMCRNWFLIIGWPELLRTAAVLGSVAEGFEAMFT